MFFDHSLLDAFARGILLSAVGLVWLVLVIRTVGLRSLSKMTNFDFVTTVALGSLLAGAAQASGWAGFLQAMTAMAALLAVQYLVARARRRSDAFDSAVQNAPMLLMKDGEILHDALETCRVTESDLLAKLREANALDMSKVKAVVLESTGDVSVLHGSSLDMVLIEGVTRADG